MRYWYWNWKYRYWKAIPYTSLQKLKMRLCLVWFILMVISWTRLKKTFHLKENCVANSQKTGYTLSNKIFCILMPTLKRKTCTCKLHIQITHSLLYWAKWIFSFVIYDLIRMFYSCCWYWFYPRRWNSYNALHCLINHVCFTLIFILNSNIAVLVVSMWS